MVGCLAPNTGSDQLVYRILPVPVAQAWAGLSQGGRSTDVSCSDAISVYKLVHYVYHNDKYQGPSMPCW